MKSEHVGIRCGAFEDMSTSIEGDIYSNTTIYLRVDLREDLFWPTFRVMNDMEIKIKEDFYAW